MEVEEKDTQLRERDTQIDRQQRELQAVRVRNTRQRYCVVVCDVSICLLGGQEEVTGGGRGEGDPTQ